MSQCTLDDDFIISEVYARPELWDKSLGVSRKLRVVNKIWRNLAQKHEVPEEVLKKRWRFLRDAFSSNLLNIPKSVLQSSSDRLDYEKYVTWPLFGSMLFLKDHIGKRGPNWNIWQRAVAAIEQDETSFDGFSPEQPETSSKQPETYSTESETSNKQPEKQRRQSKTSSNKTETYSKPPETSRKRTADRLPDEDDHFVSSLLSHLRRINPAQKLLCRMEIQRVVNEYAYGQIRLPQTRLDLDGLVRDTCEGLSEEYFTEEVSSL
ncbi:uncharacterized protein LOC129755251 [Uranotaenia lowii]|uniref:uncharacterized protein LOC129755251 n=1 Tax=Uranotaenia lowii TaxID=190385 RepID=UPI0024797497|nr:uncharacterized protein LOC129755251 [Uranotaenia lowii]XP_055607614.1 uncharacterized protein LOC129755251 [Uranotaenia lowii]